MLRRFQMPKNNSHPLDSVPEKGAEPKNINGCEGCGEPIYLSRYGYSHVDTTLNVSCDARPKASHDSVPKRVSSSKTLDVERAENWLATNHPEFSSSRRLAEVLHDYSLTCFPTEPVSPISQPSPAAGGETANLPLGVYADKFGDARYVEGGRPFVAAKPVEEELPLPCPFCGMTPKVGERRST